MPKAVAAFRFSSANRTLSRICLSTGSGATLRLFTMLLPNGATIATARSAISFVETLPVSAIESRLDWTWMFSVGNVSLSSLRRGLQVLFDIDAVDGSLSCTRPNDDRGAACSLRIQQHFPRTDRHCVDDCGIAGRYLPDVARIVEHDALADRKAQLFDCLSG